MNKYEVLGIVGEGMWPLLNQICFCLHANDNEMDLGNI